MTSRLPPSGTLIWLRLVPSAYISRIFWQALRSRVPCKVAMFDDRTFCRLPQSARVSPVMVMMTFSVLLPRMSSVRRRPRTTMVPLTFFRCQSPMESSRSPPGWRSAGRQSRRGRWSSGTLHRPWSLRPARCWYRLQWPGTC